MHDGENDKSRHGWIGWMARNPVAANLLMVLMLVGGLATMAVIKQEFFPEYELDMVQVTAVYPGATPLDVERGILLAIEEQVRGLDGVKQVSSVAGEGVGTVVVELQIGANNNKALQDVKNAVDRITSFPEQIERPTVSLLTTRPKVIDLVVYGGNDSVGAEDNEHALRGLAEMARARLLQNKSITYAPLSGVRRLETAVEVPQANLRAYGLTLADIAQKIRRTALELPAGSVKTSGGEVLLRTAERRDLAPQFREIPLIAGSDGTPVRLGDIATVTDGFADTDQSTHHNGKQAAIVQVYRSGDQTPIQVANIVKEFAKTFQADLTDGFHVTTQDDMSEIYRDRINLLLRNALLGLILVLCTLGIFLELRLAFWVTMGIPVSFLGAILLMPSMAVSINMISLFAFIMALGMVVDDAIIVGENVYEMRQRGVPYMEAAIKGARQIFVPVVFSVLTNMVAFAPMLFVPGVMGKVFRVIPSVIILVFFISLIESLLILPAHLGHLRAKRSKGVLGSVGRLQSRLSNRLAWSIRTFYGPLVRLALRWRYFTVAIGLAVLVVTVGFIAGGRIDVVFMPRVASDFATATVRLPYGAPVSATRDVKDRLVQAAYDVVEKRGDLSMLRGVQSRIGSGFGRHGPDRARGASTGGHSTSVRVFFIPEKLGKFSVEDFKDLWRKRVGEIPDVEKKTFKSELGPGGSQALINIRLSHLKVAVLESAATDLARRLKEFSGVKDIDSGFSPGKPQRSFTRTREAEALGIESRELGTQMRHAFYGAEALRQQRGRDEIRVMVRLPKSERGSEYDIEELVIRTRQGGEIMLAEASHTEHSRSYTQINRTDGRRTLDVTADVDKVVTNANKVVGEVAKSVMPELMGRYPGLTFTIEGERKGLRELRGSLGKGLALALIVIFAMLAIPLKSYLQPIIIMSAIPFGIVGAVLGHVVMGYDLSLMSFMGIVALAGVVVNDSLVLICSTNDRRLDGADAFEAISNAGVRRFRPILLTSLTTFFGLMPMIFETSMQARFLIPMAISMGYGVLMATFITLLLVPALYLIIEDVRRVLGGSRRPD